MNAKRCFCFNFTLNHICQLPNDKVNCHIVIGKDFERKQTQTTKNLKSCL